MKWDFVMLVMLSALQPMTAGAATYSFTLAPAGTSLSGTVTVAAGTAGFLVGDYEAEINPTGTRTKPGLFGPFGGAENLPVPVELAPGLQGAIESVPTGSLVLEVDESTGRVILSGLSVNFLPAGPAVVPSELTLAYDSFRTRTPDSLFIGGFPLTLPLGGTELSALAAAQIGSAAGALSGLGSGLYDFSISTVLLLSGSFESALGSIALPPLPVPYTLIGRIGLAGEEAMLTASSALAFSNESALGIELPSLPFPLPTILPPGATAGLLLELTVDSLTTELSTSFALAAPGRLIPEPGSALVVSGLLWALAQRRRRLGED